MLNPGPGRPQPAFFRGAVCAAAVSALLANPGGEPRAAEEKPVLRAGAAAVDISPRQFPVTVNGGFFTRSVKHATGPLHARCLVLERGGERLALVVVDSCMVPREVCDEIKRRAAAATGIPAERMLVAATHTHSAPSLMDFCLGTMRDEDYTAQMIPQVAEAIATAHGRLEPALVGAASVDAWHHTHCRRWIRRSDRIGTDPFGSVSVRAMMHPKPLSDSVGPAGPVDPALTVLSVTRPDGRPLALLANFSMHYVGAEGVSPDYFGGFARAVEETLERERPGSGCVAMMSQGTSGDLHRARYDPDVPDRERGSYHGELAALALEARAKIVHSADAPLALAQAELELSRRTPDAARLAWARRFDEALDGRPPATLPEVYAVQARWLNDHPEATLVIQAARIGDLAIFALPNEVYGITGLKLKRQSPLPLTMVVGLANGAEGYIPPPEQHALGGYTTWPASTAGLEVEAEPRIVEAALGLVERASGMTRREVDAPRGPAAEAVVALRPFAYWRLDEIGPPRAADAVGDRHGEFEDGVAFHLPGVGSDPRADAVTAVPEVPSLFSGPRINRAPHFAGGRLRVRLPGLPRDSSAVLWLWNGFPTRERPFTGFAFSRGTAEQGDHLGIGGTDGGHAGAIVVTNGKDLVAGRTPLGMRRWHHVALVREGDRIRVHLDGRVEPDLDAELPWTPPAESADVFVGGRADGSAGFEGKIDEVAIFDRPLAGSEIAGLFAAAGRQAAIPAADTAAAAEQPVTEQPPLGPDEAVRQILVPRGFRVELAAAEPQVLDPVAFDWDAAGRLWVVEMADYPSGMDGAGKPGGRIRVLADGDADGRYETATLFAEGLNFPNGCLTWRDGVIVTAAPEILFLADTDGDGRADRREVLVRGLAEANQQLRPNGLRWGLDNWVYVASGSPGRGHAGTLTAPRSGTSLVVGARDFRFRPDTGELEAEAGPTQFGRNRDDWGHWFGTQNARPLWHYVMPERYAVRNPWFVTGRSTQMLLPADVAVHPAQPPEKRYHSFQQAGHYTSACGGMVHRDPRLFGTGTTTAFVCEPFHNLVQRVRLKDAGVSFVGEPVVEDGRDFLTSTDRWFRPVMVRTGPDGGLWVADMYRSVIEHPDWLPPAGRAELLPKFRHGDDKGRIYRISRADAAGGRIPDLRPLDGPALAGMLLSENGFIRDKAHQMLLWRGGDDAVPALRALARDASRPLGSLHAACVLDGLGKLGADDLLPALAADHAGLRANALRLSEPSLRAAGVDPRVLAAVVAAATSGSPRVRLQAALTCGETGAPAAGAALADLLVSADGDPFIEAAVLSSATPHAPLLAAAAVRAGPPVLDGSMVPLLRMAVERGDGATAAALLAAVGDDPAADTTVDRMSLVLDALEAAKTDLSALAAAAPAPALARQAARIDGLFDAVLAVAESDESPIARRIAAARVAVRSPAHRGRAVALLTRWLSASQPPDVQRQVVGALAAAGGDEPPLAFAAFWPESSPAIRPAVLEAWMGREPWCIDLLARVGSGEVAAAAIDATIRARLRKHPSAKVSGEARALFAAPTGSRAEVVERYRSALAAPGDAARGLVVYRRACTSCHRHGDEGRAIGPDVGTFAAHSPEKLLANILDPSSDIQPGYHAFACVLDSGEQLYGIVVGETATSITFKCVDASEKTIPRGRIETLRAMNASLMPEGLEASLTPADVADLIAFLKDRPPAAAPPAGS